MARVRHNVDVQLETLAGDLYKTFEDPSGKVDGKKAIAQIAQAHREGRVVRRPVGAPDPAAVCDSDAR